MNGLIEAIVGASVKQRRVILALVLVLAAFAVWFSLRLRLDALPDVTSNQVIILTRAPGLTPEEVERLITRRVETEVGGLTDVVEQRSLSRFGISSVTVVFEGHVDPWLARQQVQERITGLAAELPAGVEAPALGPYTGGLGEIVHVAVGSSQRSEDELLELVELRIAPLLRSASGVVEVNTWGGRQRTLDVHADAGRMARHRVTLSELQAALSRASASAAGASVPAGSGQALLRGVSWPTDPVDLGAAILRPGDATVLADGRVATAPPLRIADVAEVRWGSAPRLGAATLNGRGETVYVMAQMAREQNALEVVHRIHRQLELVREVLPEDVRVELVYDRSELVEATLETVGENLVEGAVLVAVVLVVMLGSLRAGLVVATVIPLAMMGASVGMVLFGIPGNLMSLGAIDFGLLVDGAVVMVERCFHELADLRTRIEHGSAVGDASSPSDAPHSEDPNTAGTTDEHTRVFALTHAMKSVAAPMAFSVGVIVLVYVPILALQGVDGKMFRPMAITVVLALITALVLSLTWIPAVSAMVFHPRHVGHREPWLVRFMRAGYEPVLRAAVARPGVVVVCSVGAIAAGLAAFTSSGAAFVPTLDEGDLVIQTTRAADISLEDAVEDAQHLERVVLDAAPEVERVVSRIGSPAVATDIMGYEQADVMVRLAPKSAWRPGLTKEALVAEIAAAVEREDPWAGPSYTQPIQMRFNELLGGAVTDVAIEIYGEDLDQLRHVANEVLLAVQDVDGAADARILAPPSVPVLDVRPRVLDAALVGMDAVEVLDVVRAVRVGVDAGETWIGPVRVPIRVRLGEGSAAFDLGELGVPTRDGRVVPLQRIADVEIVETPALVNRHQAQRRMIVGFNVRERSLGEVVDAARARIAEVVKIPTEVRVEWGGQVRSLEEARARMAVVVPVVMVAILVVLTLLFRAISPALLIFLEVPFAGIGGAIVLWARDMPISISATIGFIALSGIAVLNGVVLVAGVRHQEQSGASPAEAALGAAKERFRPVMMTALVAALGFVPMATATGIGAEVQRPLATVVVGGLVTSTLLTLVVLPAVYPAWQRLWRGRRV